MAYFKIEESPYNTGKYLIKPDFEKLPLKRTEGSYNVLPARVMGITYANYLRLCRDEYGAEIIGKNSSYPVAYFNEISRVKELVKELDKRVTKIRG